MDYETFSIWIMRDHNLYLSYADKGIVIATNLMCLDEVGFNIENNTDNYSYPSFN